MGKNIFKTLSDEKGYSACDISEHMFSFNNYFKNRIVVVIDEIKDNVELISNGIVLKNCNNVCWKKKKTPLSVKEFFGYYNDSMEVEKMGKLDNEHKECFTISPEY